MEAEGHPHRRDGDQGLHVHTRLDDCQRTSKERHDGLARRVEKLEDAVGKIVITLATARGAYLVFAAVIAFAASLGGSLASRYLWPPPAQAAYLAPTPASSRAFQEEPQIAQDEPFRHR